MKTLLASVLSVLFLGCASGPRPTTPERLGTFSISLAVKDLRASQRFYEGLGFTAIVHPPGEVPGYGTTHVMLRSGTAMIGLFQGLFDKNAITFNPPDVRAIQRDAKAAGIAFTIEANPGTGPAAAFTTDPDGNPVLLDQH